jgi:hypothetical protein
MAEETINTSENLNNDPQPVDQLLAKSDFLNPASIEQPMAPKVNWQDNFINKTNFIKDNTAGISPNYPPSQVAQTRRDGISTGSVEAILEKGISKINGMSDKGSYAEPYAYDAGPKGTFRDKYKGYGQETYNKIGFHPLIDNDTWFNQNTTFGDDITKWATNSMWPMLSKGFMDPIRSYKSIIDGDGLFYADEKSARDYAYYNAIGSSTKGGLGGFTVNLLNSASYSLGILAEGATEGALIGAIFGGGNPVAGAAEGGTSFLRKLGSLPKALVEASKATKTLLTEVKNYSNISKAKELYTNAGKSFLNFANPLHNTTAAYNQLKNTDNLTNLARSATTAGALWHDIMAMNLGLSEGKLEGGFTRYETYDRLYNEFLLDPKNKGVPPDLAQQESMMRQASKGAWWNTLNNSFLIYYTNKLVFPSITNASFLKGTARMGFGSTVTNVGKEYQILFDPGKKALEGAFVKQRVNFVNAIKSLAKPATYGKVGLNYFKANVFEGIQEVSQDILQEATQNYYVNTFKNPDARNFRYGTGLLGDAIGKQWSSQGLETFLSGFLMGTILQAPGKIKSYATIGYNDYFKKDASYQKYITGREKLADDVVTELNTMYKSGQFFLDPRINNYANQALVANVIDNPDEHTTKEIRDAEFTAFQSAVISSLQTGTFDMFLKHYEGYKQASPEDIEQAWSLAPGQGVIALERFDKSLENAKEISKRWVSAKEKMKFEANLDDYEKDSEEYRIAQVYNKAYSQSLFNYVFLRNSFDDNLSRIDKIYSELGQLTSIQNSNFSNFVNLTDSGRLTQEIEMLKTEVENLESFGSTPALEEASKKRELIELYSSFNEKQEKLVDLFLSKVLGENNIVTGRLNNIKKNIQESDTSLSSDEVTKKAIESLIKDYDEGNTNEFTEYKEAFTSLLFGLADTSAKRLQLEQEIEKIGGIDQIFDSLIDTHVLKNENASLINYVNTLSNPREFYEHLMRNFKFMKDLYNNREEIAKEIVNKEIEAIENNTLLNTLADQGYYIDLDEFAEWIENKTLPEQFIDARNNRIINKGSVLYEELIQIFIRAAKLAAKKPAGDPLNQKQLLDKRIQSLESDRDDAIQREKEKYEEAFKKVYGITPQEYEEQEASRVAEEEISDEERKELEDLKKLFESAVKKLESDNYIEVQAAAEVIADKVFNEESDKQNAQEFFEEQVQIYMNDPEKKALIIKLKDKYDSEDMDDNVDAALKSQIYGEAVATALSLIEETLNKKSSAPTIDVENNKDYILYQEAVQTINEKYDALINEVKEDFSKKGVDETTPDEYTTKTDFEDFDAEFQDEITELFDAYLVDVLMENISLKSTNPLDYEKFRTNWLERQAALINKFNEQSKQKAQERARRLSEPPILKFAPAKIDGTTPTFTISSMIGALNRYLEAGEYTDPKDKNKKIQLTTEDITNINDDIAALNGYLYARVSMAEPRNIAEETINLIQENVINKEEEIVILYDDEGNMIGRTFKDRGPEDPIPERTTQVAEEIETTLLDKDPFVYNALKDTVNENGEVVASPVENLFNQFFSDPEVQAEDKVRLFMEAFKRKAFQAGKGGWKQFRYQEKLDAVENSLKTVGTLEDLKRTIEKYAFKESSDAGDYVDTLIKIFLTPNAANKSNFSEFTYDSAIEVKGNMKKISDMMSKKVFDKLFAPVTTTNPGGIITKFRLGIIDGTYRILSENVTLFDKSLRNGRGVTGEIDLLLVREDGSVAIVDIKTSTEYKWKDFGKGTDYDKSTYFRAQQSIYGTMFYNNTAITPDLKLMPFSLVLSEDKIGYIEDIDLASIVPEGQDTIELEYLPEIANFGIDKITPNIKAPVRTATTDIRIVESTIKKNAVEFKIKSKKDNTVIREFIIYKKGEIVIIEPIQGSNAKTLDISETEKEDLLKQFISEESLDLIYQHRESPSDKTIKSSLQQSLNKDAASATSRLSRPTDTKADVNGIPESDPTLNTLKDNIDKAVIYNGRVGKLVRMPDGNFGVEVTINNDITVLQLTLDALNANLLLEKNQFGSQELIEELEKNITKISNAISSSKGITEVFPLQKDLKNISNGEITLDKAGVQLIVPINSIGELSTIKGKVISVSFSNQEETIASINGVRYDIVRDGSGNITVLSYMSNAEKINAIDNEINERNNKINKLRNTDAVVEQDGSVTWDYRKDSIITRIVDLQDEIKALVGKRTSLFETNKKTYLYGENANDYIFALNRLPNNFQRLTRTATKANETQDLKSISSLSLNRSVADAITVILSEQYPEAMDKLIDGDTKSLDSKDLLNIQLWIEDTVNKLNQLGYSVINRGDLVDDIANQIAVLNEISNNLALIKLTKDGKIKNFKQVAEIFREPGVQKRSSVPKNEGTSRGKTKSSPGPATREELQDLVKKAREENLGDVFGEPAAAKVNSAVIEKIMNAKLSNIEEIYQTEFLKAQANDEDITGLTEAYNARLQELKTIVSLQNVEVGEYLITKKFIFIGPTKVGTTEIVIVTKVDSDKVTLKNIKTDASREFTEAELVENFEKTTMEATQPEPEVEITQFDVEDSNESKNTINELIKNGQDAIAEAKEKAKASDKQSRLDKLGINSIYC